MMPFGDQAAILSSFSYLKRERRGVKVRMSVLRGLRGGGTKADSTVRKRRQSGPIAVTICGCFLVIGSKTI